MALAFVIALALMLTILIGLTRVYLGIHYPTDIFGGWCIGAACAIAWMGLAHRLGIVR